MGNRVWLDVDGDGIQDAGEGNVSGVKVELHMDGNGSVLETNTTDSNGLYHFDNLRPGKYYVVFSNLPPKHVFTQKDAGGDNSKDSDVNLTTGKSDIVTLVSNQDDNSTDAGIYEPVSIGDYTWEDMNHDGEQNSSEPALRDVNVTLWRKSTGLKVTKDLNGSIFGTAGTGTIETNSTGEYIFANLRPDEYFLKVYSTK